MTLLTKLPLLAMVSSAKAFAGTTRPAENGIAAVLFDIDGTLVDSDPVHYSVFRELLSEVEGFNGGILIDEDFFRSSISGRSNAQIAADFFPDWSVDRRERWSEMKEARFREAAASTMMRSKMPGLDRLRDWLNERDGTVRRAAVTNAPRLNAEAIIGGIGYDGWFETLVIGDECERAKPDPCPYLTACGALSVEPGDCIVFEDSPSGATAGKPRGRR